MIKIHCSADVSPKSKIGSNTKIWHQAQIREGAKIGDNCIIGKGVYIDHNVVIGSNVKIQNYSSIYSKAIIEDGVFIGPYTCITNDKNPRAINPDESLKSDLDWVIGETIIKKGASIGAGSIILPNIVIGEFALIGAGSVISKNITDHALVFGVPARIKGYVCRCGGIITKKKIKPRKLTCKKCLTNEK